MSFKTDIKAFCELNPRFSKVFQREVNSEGKWSDDDVSECLNKLAGLFLLKGTALNVARHFPSYLLDLLHRAAVAVGLPESDRFSSGKHKRLCVALAVLMPTHQIAIRFALDYFSRHPSIFHDDSVDHLKYSPPKKKLKLVDAPSTKEIVESCYAFIQCAGEHFISMWDWTPILDLLKHDDEQVRWLSSLCVSRLCGFSPAQTRKFLGNMFKEDRLYELGVSLGSGYADTAFIADLQLHARLVIVGDASSVQDHQHGASVFCSDVASVAGVLLPCLKPVAERNASEMVSVPSTHNNLRNLALSVKRGSPVLLQGPIGSGKTSLVEHLARVTGRAEQPHFLKVQLGDQTDSKMLLGTYRCTDVPGEFIWQPGTLLQAVQNGYWILLEDIDCAPMDVISILIPLIEENSLMVPGHSKAVKPAPNFRLFATQRLLGGSTGLYKANANHSVVLNNLFSHISVDPLSPEELKQVILTRWPPLSPVIDRIVEVYLLISSGMHEMSLDELQRFSEPSAELQPDTGMAKKFIFSSSEGRPISTRDLLKWCQRMNDGRSDSDDIGVICAFQDALDCFCHSVQQPSALIAVAGAIATKLNVPKTTADYYCTKHKPVIKSTLDSFSAGRATLPKRRNEAIHVRRSRQTFAFTRQGSALLEQISVALSKHENVLLVGETGTGKTATVQYLAEEMGCKLVVINMNQNSDSADLLGGFKPVDLKFLVRPIKEEYEDLFVQTFSRSQNSSFIGHVNNCFAQKRWKVLFDLILHTHKMADDIISKSERSVSQKAALIKTWRIMGKKIVRLQKQQKQSQSALAFSFIEGSLVRAVQDGNWVLLDEINLASQESLECLYGLLESHLSSLLLVERGDTTAVKRHPDFRLVACMNPATDVGKRDLPAGLRNRFTEFFVADLEDVADLQIMVRHYLKSLTLTGEQLNGVVQFYRRIRQEALKNLTDGMGHRPHFSLRTLCRALKYAAGNPCQSVPKSLYESFCLSFLTQLDRSSHPIVENLVSKYLLCNRNVKGVLGQSLKEPPGNTHINLEDYWVPKGDLESNIPEGYILTPSVRRNLKDIVRVVSVGKHPILLQGETSIGKTSLIKWLADASGNRCIRVNNHEFTDLQEYVGAYAADRTGKLVFKEGVLVDAMRKGHWIILDELNLAPTDVLEALNRVLDDNRELFIPETQETVKAHPKFILFATQNPAGLYGGRRVLSRAFRNRFIELHFDEIPQPELETILHLRCSLPSSYCRKLVSIMNELQTRRSSSGIFAGKRGLITLRDLFRWAERYRLAGEQTEKFYDWDRHLAEEGYILLAGRARRSEEVKTIVEVIEKYFKCRLDMERIFSVQSETASPVVRAVLREVVAHESLPAQFDHLVWTYNMRRLAVLVGKALHFGEPVLLVGDTGCGKTTICQLFAALSGRSMYSVNCHMHSEGTDFLGGLRPVRNQGRNEKPSGKDGEEGERLFEWVDGPLVSAMKCGAVFLADEISLADDSVLERLNSVLEPERTLLLAEKGSTLDNADADDCIVVVAQDNFRFVATMNPGGDYGKKELSPALRNRFTEIWCPSSSSRQDVVLIIEHNLAPGLQFCNQEDGTSGIGHAMLDFLEWFNENVTGHRIPLSIRDILSWVGAINTCTSMEVPLDVNVAYVHGACLVFLDAIGAGNESFKHVEKARSTRQHCLQYLLQQVQHMTGHTFAQHDFGFAFDKTSANVVLDDSKYGLAPFFVKRGPIECQSLAGAFTMESPTTRCNALRILRAMQLTKPILLEGSPGVGKTSLIVNLAKAAGHRAVRINLSEQTDISDLFGADLPVEGGKGGQFAWRDGPLLRALNCGDWVIIDELNLASQSVLEGLNACLDHRGEIYVPELCKTFRTPANSVRRIFACQNPLSQGGSRKGLPKSFLNRFVQVYIEPLSTADLEFITMAMYSIIPVDIVAAMVRFNQTIHEEVVVNSIWGTTGGPWEINLRDVFRWCDLLVAHRSESTWNPGEFVWLIYAERMRTPADKKNVLELYEKVFGTLANCNNCHLVSITSQWLQIGHSLLPRSVTEASLKASRSARALHLLPNQLSYLQSLMKCVEMNWMAILVGSHASGKSSLVTALAELSGAHLEVLSMNTDMDTTELLGGFQQSDLNRHLDEVSGGVESILYSKIQELLQSPDQLAAVGQLMRAWFNYESIFNKAFSGTTKEEAAQFLQKLQKLRETMGVLRDHGVKEALDHFEARLASMESRVREDESVNCGGRFEWVDSMLVGALQKGHWLLIDNVNFCSASVLDRLNGLLEPNGVLSISERGICNEEIPTYKPHPNFRLILSMNPKNGEISRAMRNRGVEIYVEDQEEIENINPLELKTLLDSFDLTDEHLQSRLTGVHVAMRSAFTVGEKPAIGDLFRAAQLTAQRIGEGDNASAALRDSCRDVYLSSQHQLSRKHMARLILEERLGLGEDSKDSTSKQRMTRFDPLLRINEFAILPEVARAKQQSAAFRLIFEQVHQTIENLESHYDVPPMHDHQDFIRHFSAALKLLLQTSSVGGWKLRIDWLRNVMDAHSKTICQSKDSKDVYLEFYSAIGVVERAAMILFSLETAKRLENKIHNLLNSCGWHGADVSYDLRWNPDLLRRLIATRAGKLCPAESFEVDSMCALANRCHLLLTFLLSKFRFEDKVEDFVSCIKQHSTSRVSLLELSLALSQGVKSSQKVPKVLVVNVYNFFKRILEAVEKILGLCEPFNDELAENWDVALKWLNRFYATCCQPCTGEGITPSEETSLNLHWSWLCKRSFGIMFGENWKGDNFRAHPNLWPVYDKLARHFGNWQKFFNPMGSKVMQSYGHPQPYRSESEAMAHSLLQEIWLDLLKVISASKLGEKSGNLRHMKENRFHVRARIESFLSTENLAAEDLEAISLLETEVQSLSGKDCQTIGVRDSNAVNEKLGPIIQHLELLLEHKCINRNATDLAAKSGRHQLGTVRHLAEMCWQPTPQHLSVLYKIWNEPLVNANQAAILEWKFHFLNLLWERSLESYETPPRQPAFVESSEIYEVEGPGRLYTPQQSILGSAIIVCRRKSTATGGLSILESSLGECSEQISVLQDLGTVIWNNSCFINPPHEDVLVQDLWYGISSLVKLFCTLLPICAETTDSKVHQSLGIVNDLKNCPTFANLIMMDEQFELLCQFFGEATQNHTTNMKTMWEGLEDSVASLFAALKTFSCYEEIVIGCRTSELQHQLASLWINLGWIQMYLLLPIFNADPALKRKLKLGFCNDEMRDIKEELTAINEQMFIITGRSLDDCPPSSLHPYITLKRDRLCHLSDQVERLSQNQAVRPTPSKYEALRHDFIQYSTTVGSIKSVVALLKSLKDARNASPKTAWNSLKKVKVWIESQFSFLRRVQQLYPWYRDLTLPCVTGILQMVNGMSLKLHFHEVDLQYKNLKVNGSDLHHALGTILAFPSVSAELPGCLDLSKALLASDMSTLIRNVCAPRKSNSLVRSHQLRILKSGIMELQNHVASAGFLKKEDYVVFESLLQLFVTAWQQQEAEKRRKEIEKENLFEYKTKVYGEVIDEEKDTEKAIKISFPSYHEDFADLTRVLSLDDVVVEKDEKASDTVDEDVDLGGEITQQEIIDIAAFHREIVLNYLADQKAGTQCILIPNFVEPFLERFTVAADILAHCGSILDYRIDALLLNGLAVVGNIEKNILEAHSEVEALKKQKAYDFYRDSNVSEVVSCRLILENFSKRVGDLLCEWPDHPALIVVLKLIVRILDFPVTSPVMKFVTGFELLLEQAQDWEKNAHKGVSVRKQLEAVLEQIIVWRKLEIRCWSSCLDTVENKVRDSAAKWWFHLYVLTFSFLNPPAKDTNCEPASDDTSVELPATIGDICETLQRFMETSPMGEYKARLDLMFVFSCHLMTLKASKKQGQLTSALWNYHQYYSQFLPAVTKKLQQLRQPVEKDVKGFAKITKWSGIDFYTVKEAVDKSHRFLYKHSKQYDTSLQQPANAVFADDGLQSGAATNPGVGDCEMDPKKILKLIGLKPIKIDPTDSFIVDPLLSKVPRFCVRMHKLCKRVVKRSSYLPRIDNFNCIVGEIIEHTHELRLLEVNQSLSKEKQKSEAKHINLRKRKALSDLFKMLTDYGLSYRKGQIFSQESEERRKDLMLLPPIQISNDRSGLMDGGNCVNNCWQGCPEYFYRSVARMALLQSALQEPSKELGTAILQRCQGFVWHLLQLCTDQRRELSCFVSTFFKIKTTLKSICTKKAKEEGLPLYPAQQELRNRVSNFLDHLAQIQQCLGQFLVLLRSCPAANENPRLESITLGPRRDGAPFWRMRRGDQLFTESIAAVEDCIERVCSIRDSLVGKNRNTPLTEQVNTLTWATFRALSDEFERFREVVALLPASLLSNSENFSALNNSLNFAKDKSESLIQDYLLWKQKTLNPHKVGDSLEEEDRDRALKYVERLQRSASKLTSAVLISIQEIYKSEDVAVGEPKLEERVAKKSEDAEIDNNLFFSKLQGRLKDNIGLLKINLVQKRLEKVMKLWNEVMDANLSLQDVDKCTKVMLLPLPLVKQHMALCEFYLVSAVKAHRVTAKTTTVLLGIFVELVRKGFCLPVEYSDEPAGEGSLSFQDIEGGGIGEGEGKKDVSDRIENEDQLEEAHQEGMQKEEKKSEQQNLKDEENGIEMTDDFEGGLQDAEDDKDSQKEDSDDENSEEELEKQMGDLKDEDADKLDEKIWGDDDDDSEEENEEDDADTEDGPGDGQEEESRLVANEDNKSKEERESGKPEKKEEDEEGNEGEEKLAEINLKDEREFEEDKPDPYYDDGDREKDEPQDMELPEDLNLDDGNEKDGSDEGESDMDDKEQSDDAKGEETVAEEVKEDVPEDIPDDKGDEKSVDQNAKGEEVMAEETGVEEEEGGDPENEKDAEPNPEEGARDDQEAGLEPKEDEKPEERAVPSQDQPTQQDSVQPSESATKESSSDAVEKAPTGKEDSQPEALTTNVDPSEEAAGIGEAEAVSSEGHQGEKSKSVVPSAAEEEENNKKRSRQRIGQTNEKRSLGSADESHHKRLKTEDASDAQDESKNPDCPTDEAKKTSDVFQHIRESNEHYDEQVQDAATAEQLSEQAVPSNEENDKSDNAEIAEEIPEEDSKGPVKEKTKEMQAIPMLNENATEVKKGGSKDTVEEMEVETSVVEGEKVETQTVERGFESTIHTQTELLSLGSQKQDMERLRLELKDQLQHWSSGAAGNVVASERTVIDLHEAQDAWRKYEEVTQHLSQELCEQLRLILEPSLTSKLRGDYRTGKRLNMRKVIQYLASQFRKDKIWLRRTKPCKRDYQIMLAIDDSSSMADNNLKQLTFEALALINKALILLEVGDIAIARFGETVQVTHHLGERFTDEVGARMFAEFTFQQKKTRVGMMLDHAVSMFLDSRKHQHGSARQLDVAQLAIIVSDGRGIFNEGCAAVNGAVRRAKESGIFTFFIALDNPSNKDSIFDIRVPVFQDGKLPEIKSYMDDFPFPFYIILRDINSLPSILGDALRQWFELITSSER